MTELYPVYQYNGEDTFVEGRFGTRTKAVEIAQYEHYLLLSTTAVKIGPMVVENCDTAKLNSASTHIDTMSYHQYIEMYYDAINRKHGNTEPVVRSSDATITNQDNLIRQYGVTFKKFN